MRIYYLWCTPSAGVIHVGLEKSLPLFAVLLARSTSATRLRNLAMDTCRRMWTGEMCVPGLPEAGFVQRANGVLETIADPSPASVAAAKLAALNSYAAWLRHLARPGVTVPDHYHSTPVASWDPPTDAVSVGAVTAAKEEVESSAHIH